MTKMMGNRKQHDSHTMCTKELKINMLNTSDMIACVTSRIPRSDRWGIIYCTYV